MASCATRKILCSVGLHSHPLPKLAGARGRSRHRWRLKCRTTQNDQSEEYNALMSNQSPGPYLGKIHFVPNIPERLRGLLKLSRNLWWTWNPKARELFRMIDLETWKSARGNAVRFLRDVPQARLDAAAEDSAILERHDDVMAHLSEYLTTKDTWWNRNHGAEDAKALIAYFSAEYGWHETLQTYSGGLGVLAGDHCKSASDLGLPMVAVGLLYRDGYFQQYIDENGQQVAIYESQRWEELPVREVRSKDERNVLIEVEFPGRIVTAKVWVVRVGRIRIFLLDTDVPENMESDRQLTARLYGGDQETRIQQEILLGIGGIRALRKLHALGILERTPTLYHMNEGHSAFLSLERMRDYIREGLKLHEAVEVIRSSSLFTTHTPVPAGHDRFPVPLMEKYFRSYYESIPMSRAEFLDFGLEPLANGQQLFSMTILALHTSSMANGVSQLHSEVSRKMMAPIFRDVPPSETPIDHVSNGVHTRTWMSFEMQNLFDRFIGEQWRERIMDREMWEQAVEEIPDDLLWETKSVLKGVLVRFIHERLRQQHYRHGERSEQLDALESIFTTEALTIGFARRFATYKRATLLFHNMERLARILRNPDRPVQIVFSGKAHPADKPGQDFIRRIFELSKLPEFHNSLVFLENYDMNVGRRLTSGVDLWLNTPRRPNEASGTSGMKVPLNAGLNCSILDGWWPEAYRENPATGWAIGYEKEYQDEEQQDEEDADHLYRVLERQIVPVYYNRDERGIPREWLRRVKEAMKIVGPVFSTDRMVSEYADKYYGFGSRRYQRMVADNYRVAREYAGALTELRQHWGQVRLTARVLSETPPGTDIYTSLVKEGIDVEAEVFLGTIPREDVSVEIYAEDLRTTNGSLPRVVRIPLGFVEEKTVGRQTASIYRGRLAMNESGDLGFTVRVLPNEEKFFRPQTLGLVRWAAI